MSVTCGFYNSISGDRKYNASQLSTIFDGIITDGVFSTIGDCFAVKAGSGNTVNVGIGKCWFNHSWTYNDAPLPIDCGESNSLRDRIDAIVIKVDSSDPVRNNTIECIQGVAGTNPSNPTWIDTEYVHHYPICYIQRPTGSTEITDGQITLMVGSDETPFITGLMETVSLDEHLKHWRAQLDEFVAKEEADFNAEAERLTTLMQNVINEFVSWTDEQKGVINDWFDEVKGRLGEDPAVNLQAQIIDAEIESILVNGIADGTKTFSADGSTIITVGSDGKKLTKTFSSDFSTCTTILTNSSGGELGRLIKTFSSDGNTISSELTIF